MVWEVDDPVDGHGRLSVDRQNFELGFPRAMFHNRRDNVGEAVAIQIHNYPARPVAETFKFIDCVIPRQIDRWVQDAYARKSPEGLFEKRRRFGLCGRDRCGRQQ